MSNENFSYFDLGAALGFGILCKESTDEVFINLFEDSYISSDSKFNIAEYVKTYCSTKSPNDDRYKLNISYKDYLSMFNKLNISHTEPHNVNNNVSINDKDYNLRNFISGYLNSNATYTYTPSINCNVLKVTAKIPEILNSLFLIAIPSYSEYDMSSNTYECFYINEAALDLLNCRHVHHLNTGDDSIIIDPALESARKSLTSGYIGQNNSNYATITYTKLSELAVQPSKSRASDSGYDITLTSVIKQVGDVTFYGTGITVKPPTGFYFDLVPRSSLSKQGYMLANNTGIIDSTYRGEIIVALRKFDGFKDLELPAKVVQIIPRKRYHFDIVAASDLDKTSRDSGGFGSTGS